jgi:hypothetical protein
LASKDINIDTSKDASETLTINGYKVAIKFSTLWTTGDYKFQQIRSTGYDHVLCFGISPFEAHCWFFERKFALENAKKQHKGGTRSEYWITINPNNPPEWATKYGGTLDIAYQIIQKQTRK